MFGHSEEVGFGKDRNSKATISAITRRQRPTRFPYRIVAIERKNTLQKEKIGFQNPHAKKTTTEGLHPIFTERHFKLKHPVKY